MQASETASNNATLLAMSRAQGLAQKGLKHENEQLTEQLGRERDKVKKLQASEGHLKLRLKNMETAHDAKDKKLENLAACLRVRFNLPLSFVPRG